MLIRSISGIRGLVNEDLKNEEITKYANALHDFLDPGVIYAGRDSRPSGEEITEIMIDELYNQKFLPIFQITNNKNGFRHLLMGRDLTHTI